MDTVVYKTVSPLLQVLYAAREVPIRGASFLEKIVPEHQRMRIPRRRFVPEEVMKGNLEETNTTEPPFRP